MGGNRYTPARRNQLHQIYRDSPGSSEGKIGPGISPRQKVCSYGAVCGQDG